MVIRKSKIDALAEVYPEYAEVMNDEELSVKYKKSRLTGKASAFFRRPKIRNYIAECREELAKDAGIVKAEWIEQVIVDAETARDDSQHMATAKNMELIGKACGFMDSTVTIKHESVTSDQANNLIQEQLKELQVTDPEAHKEFLLTMTGDEAKVKTIESNSYRADLEPVNVPDPITNDVTRSP